MMHPESDRRTRETKRLRINVFDGEESDEWVEAEQELVRIHRHHRRDLFSPHDSLMEEHGRIVDRWRDKETSQDLPHEWTGSRNSESRGER